MAERGFTPISVEPIFLGTPLSAGDSSTSRAIDLRYSAQQGMFSLHSKVSSGTAGTCGTTVFTYSLSTSLNGDYVTPPSAVSIGTSGTSAAESVMSFEPEMMPFMKVIATQTGSGTAGFDSKINAELIIQ